MGFLDGAGEVGEVVGEGFGRMSKAPVRLTMEDLYDLDAEGF
jgi:hypothetical protein